MATLSDLVGFTAGLCTTAAFAPQVIKTLRSRSTGDISLGMYLLLAFGSVLWLTHGLQIDSIPVVAANGVTLALVCIMLWMKIRYK
jgi:MtN3 and saliva related transmembrane protein